MGDGGCTVMGGRRLPLQKRYQSPTTNSNTERLLHSHGIQGCGFYLCVRPISRHLYSGHQAVGSMPSSLLGVIVDLLTLRLRPLLQKVILLSQLFLKLCTE